MRLTKKHILMQSRSLADNEEEYRKHEQDDLRYRKLWELENIEDELGMDIIIYFHFYFGKPLFLKDSKGKIQKIEKQVWNYHPFRKSFIWFHKGMEEIQLFVKDYGKTWALTREELQ